MLFYLFILSFVMFWCWLEYKSFKRNSFWMPLIVLSLFAGVRSSQVGTDSGAYTRRFRSGLNIDYFQPEKGIEIGYEAYEYLILKFTHNYFWLFFLSSLIIIYCYLIIIKKYSINYRLSIFLFITLGIYTFFFNGLRQGLAMAIFSLSLPFLLEKRFLYYLIICLIASLFHNTALIMIPFYFLVNLRIKPLYKIVATFLGSLISSKFLVSYIASTNERYEGYSKVSENSGGFLTLGFYTLILLFIGYIIYYFKINDKNTLKMYNFYSLGVVFIIPIALLGTNPSGPQRLLTYFSWLLVLLLPTIDKVINKKYFNIALVIFFMSYFILTTSKFSNLTPYIINPIFEIF